MESASVRALERLALLLRGVGAVWLVLLVITSWTSDQLTAPGPSLVAMCVGVVWAVVAWRARLFRDVEGRWTILIADLVVACGVIVGPRLFHEAASYTGGYPFASLLLGLAVAGRGGVVASAVVLTGATLLALGAAGATAASTTVSNVLFYGLAAASLDAGWRLLTRQQQRARDTEAALAVARERGATAAHLHDSVLQTLALVQRRAEDPDTVRSLVRRQERELREWLFGSGVTSGAEQLTLRSALEDHAEQVQADTGVAVRVVCVAGAGDVVVDGEGEAGVHGLLLATREAVVNAAVHAGVATVDVFAERAGEEVVVYVRDRGPGFQLDVVGDDRHGVRGSIIGRMERIGGTGVVRSDSRGTEVELRL